MTEQPEEAPGDGAAIRLAASIIIVAFLAFATFLLLDLGDPTRSSGVVTLTFLIAIPAALSALVSLITDPAGEKSLGHYIMVPSVIVGVVLLLGAILLREGVICLLLVAPLWIAAGIGGSSLVYLVRKQAKSNDRLYSSSVLLLPFLIAPIENANLPATAWQSVASETVIEAPPERVWPLLLSIPDIKPHEGRWNVAQDLLGVPRPTEARLVGQSRAPVRLAQWGEHVRFEEHVTGIRPNRSISWAFAFPDASVQQHTDRHISPKGPHLDISTGGYRLEPLPGGRTKVTLRTRYALRSPVNAYAAWWGELLLGGIQDNVLAIVKDRAEAKSRAPRI